jgi:pyruvate dehydrogenase (quinone)
MARIAADFITEALKQAGIKRVYGVVGDSLNGFTDSLRRLGGIEWIHTRHEEAAAFAAGAEAHLTGELAVCCGSCGPGNLHLINGLFDCHRSRVPVLAIAAHLPSSELGIDYFQSTHPEILFRECSHYVELVSHPGQLPQILERAMRVAVARSGVAVVVLPGDVALMPATAHVPSWLTPSRPLVRPNEAEFGRLAKLLNSSSKITLLCGAGCAGAHDEVIQLAERLKAPIVHPLRGKEFIEYDNPYDVGMTGFLGFASGYFAMEYCDTLLMLGTDFPYRQFYPKHARVAQVDIRPEALGNRTPLELGLLGDVRETLGALLPKLAEHDDRAHLDEALASYKTARKDLDALAEESERSTIIHPQFVTRVVSEVAADDAIFTCDVGTPTAWAARYLKMNGKRRLLGSFNHGSMANAMLQAIGAQGCLSETSGRLACRRRRIYDDDGRFHHPQPAQPARKGRCLEQRHARLRRNGDEGCGLPRYRCNLQNPDFAATARAMGVKGQRVERPQDLRSALIEAFNHDGPALVDVVSARQELILPPKATLAEATHFGMFMLKAVLDGRAKQIIDLAKVNLTR